MAGRSCYLPSGRVCASIAGEQLSTNGLFHINNIFYYSKILSKHEGSSKSAVGTLWARRVHVGLVHFDNNISNHKMYLNIIIIINANGTVI